MKSIKMNYEDWKVELTPKAIIVEKFGEQREYDLPNWSTCEHDKEYIYITHEDNSLTQFKMEVNDFWIGDKFDDEGCFVETVANHIFEKELEEDFD